jgi:cell division protein ZapA (FtsZ GTPase activity inhibitor)
MAGEKPRDHMMQMAYHVDETMKEISESMGGGSVASLAVLAALNITAELFSVKESLSEKDLEKDQLEKDILHYTQLWEEAKRNFLQYKDDAQGSIEQRDKLQERLNEKAIENDALLRAAEQKEERIKELENKLENLNNRVKAQVEGRNTSTEQIRDLEDKYKEIEGNYFELQMENIKLKDDLDRYKRIHD